MSNNMPILQRFEGNFKKTTGCWQWLTGLAHNGYGRFKWNYKSLKAHRVAYEFYIGPIPDGLRVLHMCDNPACVNPEHLTLGDDLENIRDRTVKNRTASKLKPAEIPVIRKMIAAGQHDVQIAEVFKVDRDTITAIRTNVTWKHIP